MATRPSSDRGAVIIWVTVALVMLITMLAVALNAGHVVSVRGELRNAVDAAALAGAAQLTGTAPDLLPAETATSALAAVHRSDRLDVEASEVRLGQWVPSTRTCDEQDTELPLVTPDGYQAYRGYRFCEVTGTDAAAAFRINAVYARADRGAGRPGGGPLNMAFGGLLSRQTADVRAAAIAVTGGPCGSACLRVPMVVGVGCLTDGGGFVCDPDAGEDSDGPIYALGLSSTQVRTAGWSVFSQSNPSQNAVCDYLQASSTTCTSVDVGSTVELIDVGQGTKFDGGCNGAGHKKTCDWFADYVGQMIEVPVISMSGSLSEACPTTYNGTARIVGFATYRVLAVDCKTGNGCVPAGSPWCATCDADASGSCVISQLVCNHRNGEDRSTGCAWTGTSPLRPILVR